jgi:hypothetical protein
MPFAAILCEVDQRETARRFERRAGSIAELAKEVALMNVTSLSFGLLIVLFTILLVHWMRKLKPHITGSQSQRMCPSCGLITSRLEARCLECGVASVSKS